MSQPQRTPQRPQQYSSSKPAAELNAEIKFEINKHKVNIDRTIFAKGLVERDNLINAKKDYRKSSNSMATRQSREDILRSIVDNEKNCKFNLSLIVSNK